jgi:RimJ/RimL family protein N-acetyltransferase
MIETERLILRPHAIADFDAVRRLWADQKVVRFISGTPSTTEDSWARLLRYIGHWTAFDVGYFVIADRNDGRYLGECGFTEFRREITPSLGGAAEVGWVLDPAAWGKGVATEAMTAVIDWYRRKPDAKPLACIIAPDNAASIKVAERLGFQLEAETLYRELPTLIYRRS